MQPAWQRMAGLTRRQEQAVPALLSMTRAAEAAAIARVSERTIFRWLKQPEFRAAVDSAARRVLADAMARLRGNALEAADVIIRLCREARSEPTRLAAAGAAFEIADRADMSEILRRLDDLEAADHQENE